MILTSAATKRIASAWNDCLDSAEFATHYTAPEFFEEGYFRQKQPFAILAAQGDVINGVVTGLSSGRDMTCGEPGSPHVCVRRGADRDAVARALAAGLQAHASRSTEFITAYSWEKLPQLGLGRFRLRSVGPPLCTILLDLSKGKDWLFRHCSETRRNKIRRALKAGVDVSEMNIERDFDDYYELYRQWCRFKGVTFQSYDMQRAALESKGNRLVLVARYDGRIVGVSTFRFRKPGLVEYAANVSRREETRIRQNDLLLWRGIEWSVEQGCFTYFSMAGAHFFLQKFGGRVHMTYRYSLDRTFLRRRDAVEVVLAATTHVYRKLPHSLRQTAKKLIRRQDQPD